MKKIYYENQKDWEQDDFYILHRFINKMFLNVKNTRIQEIKELDITRMSIITKTIIFCIIMFQHKTNLFELTNLKLLKNTKPLEERLDLVKNPINYYAIYNKYNIGI